MKVIKQPASLQETAVITQSVVLSLREDVVICAPCARLSIAWLSMWHGHVDRCCSGGRVARALMYFTYLFQLSESALIKFVV